MTSIEQKKAAKEFQKRWEGIVHTNDKETEKQYSQQFWIDLLTSVFGIPSNEIPSFIRFEQSAKIDRSNGFIDGFIPSTKVLIEQKAINKNLREKNLQSDGKMLDPFEQAKRYAIDLPYDDRPRWIITCNFKSFLVYDMNKPKGEPTEINLNNFSNEYHNLSFLVDSKKESIVKEEELSIKAGELVGELYDALSRRYNNIDNKKSQEDLNELCVRLVFCLYAEDAGLFGNNKEAFHDYIASSNGNLDRARENLIKLFVVLDTPIEKRDPYMSETLSQFPYVNGGLFSNRDIEIPTFDSAIYKVILKDASEKFDWSGISPTIFGAVFESTLNPETRRSGGMVYTSIENIHKVIDPLFLDDLESELKNIEQIKQKNTRDKELLKFQTKLSKLTFLDPACGSGNFLTETFLSLRKLENEAISIMNNRNVVFDVGVSEIKVSIQQFYGIEINDFAVKVAKTALWIAEAQMWIETQEIISSEKDISDFLPLETYEHVIEGDALIVDWNDAVSKKEINYIIGNPPYSGATLMTNEQKASLNRVFEGFASKGKLDYVACWFKKASDFMKGTIAEAAFVSTNSIVQGEQVAILWRRLFEQGIKINFCYRTFRWDSEANTKAHVFCVIIGFSYKERELKCIWDENGKKNPAKHINAYLVDFDDVFVENRTKPICDVPGMNAGSMPNDNGYLSNYTLEQKNEICEKYAEASSYFKRFVGSQEFINNIDRYCLWLNGVSPDEYNKIPPIMSAIDMVRSIRQASPRAETRRSADTPYLFGEIRQPNDDYVIIPETSSEGRKYIPCGIASKDLIASNGIRVISGASFYEFGILTSSVHMDWMRMVAGRLKGDYRYSANLVYNNFPWPSPTAEQKSKIEKTALKILDVRKQYPNSSLADLYDVLTMPKDLLKAHEENDKAVLDAYGFSSNLSESEIVANLLGMYKELTK